MPPLINQNRPAVAWLHKGRAKLGEHTLFHNLLGVAARKIETRRKVCSSFQDDGGKNTDVQISNGVRLN